jgi:tRNA A37 threonylcarbamoyladenosine biosynthesis protein TsaE
MENLTVNQPMNKEQKLVDLLNDDQKTLFMEISGSTIAAEPNTRIVVKGYAGTGKTFLLQALSEEFGNQAVFLAPTNQAVHVLEEKITSSECSTIHRFFGLVVNKDRETKKVRDSDIYKGLKIIFIDESSMVDKNIYEEYIKKLVPEDIVVVFVGDPCQLSPVGHNKEKDISPIFRDNHRTLELTQIVRQAEGNPIIQYSMQIREQGFNIKDIPFDGNKIIKLKSSDVPRTASALWDRNGITLTYTNKRNHQVNDAVLKVRYPNLKEEFFEGQDLRLDAAAKNSFDEIFALSGHRFKVVRLGERAKHYAGFEIQRLIGDDGNSYDAITKEGRKVFEQLKADLVAKKDFRKIYRLEDEFHDVRPPYSITTHKAQGSTYDVVLIDAKNLMKCWDKKERDRLAYVAVTRASDRIGFILDD